MNIKKKFNTVVDHVKSNRTIYAYMTGAVIAGVAMSVAYERQWVKIAEELKSKKWIDAEKALDQIVDLNLDGVYFKIDDINTLLLSIAPEDFQP